MESTSPAFDVVDTGFWVKDWFVEPQVNRVSQGAETVQLEPKVMQVLLCMAEQPGRTVTKDAFMQRVWADTVVTDDVLSRCISELRKVFGDNSRAPDYIETIRKTGYRLIAPVAIPEPTEPAEPFVAAPPPTRDAGTPTEGVPAAEPPAVAPSAPARWLRRPRYAFLALAALLVVVVGGGRLLLSLAAPDAVPPPRAVPFTSFPGEEIDPDYSPDGSQIAFSWDGGTGFYRNIYIKQPGAETPLPVTNVEADERSPAWAPDGQFLAFVRTTDEGTYEVHSVSSIGGGTRKLADFGGREIQSLSWWPDTSRQAIVLSARREPYAQFQVYLLDIDADTVMALTDPPAYSLGDLYPVVSPNGRSIAFARGVEEQIQDLFLVSSEGGPPQQLTFDSTRITGLTWSAQGSGVIMASERTGQSSLWRVPLTGEVPEWITSASEGTRIWDPSMARASGDLSFAQRSATVNIWEVSRERRYAPLTPKPLIASTQWDSHPSLSQTQDRIAFASRRTGHPEIWIAGSDGSDPMQVTSFGGPPTGIPRWSPDGRRLAFVSRYRGRSDIYVVDVDGGRPHRLTEGPAEDTMPTWSQDGTAVYFASNRTGAWEIWRKPVDGGPAARMSFGGGVAAQESPDGEWLYLVRPDVDGIWAQPLRANVEELPEPDLFALSGLPNSDSMSNVEVDSSAIPGPLADTLASEALQFYQNAATRRIIDSVKPYDAGNWWVTRRGIFFVERRARTTYLVYHRFSDGEATLYSRLEDIPRHPALAVAPDGSWFLYSRTDRSESDIMRLEHVAAPK